MIGLIRAESLKLFKRAPFWVMLAVLLFFVGVSGLVLVAGPRLLPDVFGEIPEVPREQLFTLGLQTTLGQTWFPGLLAAVMVGGEVGTSIWPAALTLEARRWWHVLAKLVVLTVGAILAVVVAMAVWAAMIVVIVEGAGGPSASEWLSILWKSVVIQLTWVALGIGAVGLFRSIGPAVGTVIGISILESFLALWPPWQNVSISLNQTALLGDVANLGGGLGPAFGEISVARAAVVVLAWAVVALLAAITGLAARDP